MCVCGDRYLPSLRILLCLCQIGGLTAEVVIKWKRTGQWSCMDSVYPAGTCQFCYFWINVVFCAGAERRTRTMTIRTITLIRVVVLPK
jgi:hypothetical protein